MPGDGLTHGPPAIKKAGGSHHRFSRINRHSLRDGLWLIRLLPGVHDLLVTVVGAMRKHCCQLGTSQGVPGPCDFTIRIERRSSIGANASTASPPHVS